MRDFDAIVAGAGIWGCTVARRLADAGKRVLVLEKRSVVGGNVRCEEKSGIEVHSYGSHIFHTHVPEVWNFIRRFTDFNGYQHKVLVVYKGKMYFLPLGLTLINKFFDVELKPCEVAEFMKDESNATAIFDAFFRGYTSKQWGRPPEEIDPSIIKRVPVRNNYDVNYFNDYWQGIPSEGYNKMFERMLDHENIHVETEMTFGLAGTNLRAVRNPDSTQAPFGFDFAATGASRPAVYYSGPIDALFDYKFGALPWRSLRFEAEELDIADYQGTTVVNYTEAEIPYTRIHEFKHYHPERRDVMNAPKTIIMREYPKTWEPGDEPYYPIDNESSRALLAKYQAEVEKLNRHSASCSLVVGGRLGGYKYYDMDKSIEAALKVTTDSASLCSPGQKPLRQQIHHLQEGTCEMNERLCVVMPVYNEQDAIGPVLEKWSKALDALAIDYTIRPYNDGSKDRSLEVMREVAKNLPHVDVRDKKNGGHGNTILTGYREAAAGFDWIFQIDSDDEMGPEKFGELWKLHENCGNCAETGGGV